QVRGKSCLLATGLLVHLAELEGHLRAFIHFSSSKFQVRDRLRHFATLRVRQSAVVAHLRKFAIELRLAWRWVARIGWSTSDYEPAGDAGSWDGILHLRLA